MKTIRVDFSKSILKEICRQGEKSTAFLEFVLPDDFAGADYVNAEFKKPSGKKETVELLDPADVVVPMTEELTCEAGWIGIQLTAYKVEGDEIIEIAKSQIVHGVIERSLGGSHRAGESVIERMLAFIHKWSGKLTIFEETYNEYIDSFPEIADNTDARHVHLNKEILDEIGKVAVEGYPDEEGGGTQSDQFMTLDGERVGIYREYVVNNNLPTGTETHFYGMLFPNAIYRIGSPEYPASAIGVPFLRGEVDGQANEYVIDFYSGSNPTVLALPNYIQYAGDALVPESNKHYQISILNDIAVWCEVDWTVSG